MNSPEIMRNVVDKRKITAMVWYIIGKCEEMRVMARRQKKPGAMFKIDLLVSSTNANPQNSNIDQIEG